MTADLPKPAAPCLTAPAFIWPVMAPVWTEAKSADLMDLKVTVGALLCGVMGMGVRVMGVGVRVKASARMVKVRCSRSRSMCAEGLRLGLGLRTGIGLGFDLRTHLNVKGHTRGRR